MFHTLIGTTPITQTSNGIPRSEIFNFSRHSRDLFVDKPEFADSRRWGVVERAVQDSRRVSLMGPNGISRACGLVNCLLTVFLYIYSPSRLNSCWTEVNRLAKTFWVQLQGSQIKMFQCNEWFHHNPLASHTDTTCDLDIRRVERIWESKPTVRLVEVDRFYELLMTWHQNVKVL